MGVFTMDDQKRRALGKVLRGMLPRIRVLAGKYGVSLETDDLVQDVLAKLSTMDAACLAARPPGWVNKVVWSKAKDAFQRRRFEQRYLDRSVTIDLDGAVCERGDEERPLYFAAAPTPEHLQSYFGSSVREVLKLLKEEHRNALVLFAAGYAYEEIAEMTGAKCGTVRSRLHYARKQAQELLKAKEQ